MSADTTPAATSPCLPNQIVLDTCVLISSVLRPLLLHLADHAVYTPVWSDTIGKEWRRTAVHLWRATPAKMTQQWHVLQRAYPEANMGDVSEFSHGLALSDPKDWHVVAAGRAALARQPASQVAILTRNIRDFHRAELRRWGLQLLDPDQYLVRLWKSDSPVLRACLQALPAHAQVAGRPLESLAELLHRERLFRLRRLLQPK